MIARAVWCVLLFFVCSAAGPGVAPAADVADAKYFLEIRALAQAGDAQAQFALALWLDQGNGPAQDRQEALVWLHKAAARNLAAACYTLGLKYEFGVTGKPDRRRAADLYRRAALQDLPMAQYRLGLLHLPDDGSAPDPVAAFAWLSLAAEQDYPDADAGRDRAAALLRATDRTRADEMLGDLRQQIERRRTTGQ